MKQCFGYVRVSTVKQGDGVSLVAQREAISAFASRSNIEIVQWFEEKETAAKRGRPIFNQMMKELRRGKAHGLVIHKIDRSARNFTDWAKIGDLQDAGVDIHFATESLDFASRGGRLTADIQAVIAADYIRNLREETIKGINGRLKQGLFPFRAPIGYIDNGGGKVKTPDPTRAPLVRRTFELYASRQHSYRTLLAELRRIGLTNRNGTQLTLHGLETILDNPFYCGIIRIKRSGKTYTGNHERLIPVSLFECVQDIKSGKAGPKVTQHNHLYRGLFRCGLCSGPMVPERQKGNVYYRCQARTCGTKTVREEMVTGMIGSCLERAQLSDSDMQALNALIDDWVATSTNDEAEKALTLRLSNLRNHIDRLTDALIDRLIDQEVFAERRQRLALEEEQLSSELASVGNVATRAAEMRTIIELAKNLSRGHEIAIPSEKRQWVEITTSNRLVRGKNIEIEPAKWLLSLKHAARVSYGDPDRSRDRTFFDALERVIKNPAVLELQKFAEKKGDRDRLAA
jgi:site-specific DNA recombinase